MTARPVIVLGAGGHAKVLIDLLQRLGRDVIAAVEPEGCEPQGRMALGVRIHSGDETIISRDPANVELALGIGMTGSRPVEALHRRVQEAKRYHAKGYVFPSFVHPQAIIGAGVTLGAGAQVMAGAIVQADAAVGEFVIVNTAASVDHDGSIGSGTHVAPGAVVGGGVRIGQETLVGIGAVVRQGITIGSRVLIAAGAVVVNDLADGIKTAGVPAREFAS